MENIDLQILMYASTIISCSVVNIILTVNDAKLCPHIIVAPPQ